MFIGHFAMGMGAKKLAPAVSLGTLFLAAQFVDLLWPILLLFGIEKVAISPGITKFTPLDFSHYPISHSLLASIGYSVLFGALFYLVRRNWKGAIVVGACVLSHWMLDLITHRPDLPLGLGSTTHVGLGLWNSFPGTLIVEVGLFVIAIVLYTRATIAKNKRGVIGFWGLIIFLSLIYVGNIVGPLPPDVKSLAVAGHSQWILVIWAYWLDRHRQNG